MCSVFMLQGPMELRGKIVQHRRGDDLIGTFRVSDVQDKRLVLAREAGTEALEQCDALYVEVIEPTPPSPAEPTVVKALLFSGKNWKLAGDKKWYPTTVHAAQLAELEEVGKAVVGGLESRILKSEDGFLAVRTGQDSEP